MLGVLAAVLLGVAFILNGVGAHSDSLWFTPTSFMLAGLTALALHLIGVGTAWTINRR